MNGGLSFPHRRGPGRMLYFSIPAILRFKGWPDTPEARARVVAMVDETMLAVRPTFVCVVYERELPDEPALVPPHDPI